MQSKSRTQRRVAEVVGQKQKTERGKERKPGESARRSPCESSLYLDDKEPRANGRTSLNGTDEWLWKQHLICIEGASLSRDVEREGEVGIYWMVTGNERNGDGAKGKRNENEGRMGVEERLERPLLTLWSCEKSIVLYLSIRSYILFRLHGCPRTANLFMIGHCRLLSRREQHPAEHLLG